jgi:hypothetical protein
MAHACPRDGHGDGANGGSDEPRWGSNDQLCLRQLNELPFSASHEKDE